MTDQELKKLRRSDLLELLIAQEKENEQLRSQIAQLKRRLEDRTIALEQAGSIAEASLQINGVFQAAQDAAAQYLENIQRLSGQQEKSCRRMEEETVKTTDQGMTETQETRCPMEKSPQEYQEQLPATHEETDRCPTMDQQRIVVSCTAHEKLRKILGNRGGKGVEV